MKESKEDWLDTFPIDVGSHSTPDYKEDVASSKHLLKLTTDQTEDKKAINKIKDDNEDARTYILAPPTLVSTAPWSISDNLFILFILFN